MNKLGLPTYLSNDKESLIVADDEIEGDHFLTLEIDSLLDQFQCAIKAIKLWCGDNGILNNVTPQVFPPSCQEFQRKG